LRKPLAVLLPQIPREVPCRVAGLYDPIH
jgi:hypothetical protein